MVWNCMCPVLAHCMCCSNIVPAGHSPVCSVPKWKQHTSRLTPFLAMTRVWHVLKRQAWFSHSKTAQEGCSSPVCSGLNIYTAAQRPIVRIKLWLIDQWLVLYFTVHIVLQQIQHTFSDRLIVRKKYWGNVSNAYNSFGMANLIFLSRTTGDLDDMTRP